MGSKGLLASSVALAVSDSFVTIWTVVHQAPLSMGFSRQEYWSGLPYPSPGDLPDPRIEPMIAVSPVFRAGSLPADHLGSSEVYINSNLLFFYRTSQVLHYNNNCCDCLTILPEAVFWVMFCFNSQYF